MKKSSAENIPARTRPPTNTTPAPIMDAKYCSHCLARADAVLRVNYRDHHHTSRWYLLHLLYTMATWHLELDD